MITSYVIIYIIGLYRNYLEKKRKIFGLVLLILTRAPAQIQYLHEWYKVHNQFLKVL